MMRRTTMFPFITLAALAGACGGKVVIDPAEPGAGGSGATSSSSGPASSSSTASSSSSSSSTSTSTTSSSSGAPLTLCFMGTTGSCQDCAGPATKPGGACAAAYQLCVQSDGACNDFGSCSGGCQGEQACCDKCATTFPEGAKWYGGVFQCLACEACPSECGDAVQPGFCP